MPTGSLPASGKKIWEEVHKQAIKDGDSEEVAAKKAWGAVENAGWHKDKEGKWTHKSDVQEFFFTITRAVYDKATNEYRWRANTSDTEPDSYNDSMSGELFKDFLTRIDNEEQPPEEFRSEFWSGGMPYVSISHYPDLNGDAVPGVVDALYIDGKFLKAKGRFFDNKLGRSCWESIKADLTKKSDALKPVRISIAFLDYAHQHKSNGFIFERDLNDPEHVCSECAKEYLKGEYGGKIFLKGLLVHLAMTRVPVNRRTSMEVDKSMTTRKEDAESIVGPEQAEELDKKAELVGKAELVIKSEGEEAPAPVVDPIQTALAEMRSDIANLTQIVRELGKGKKAQDDESSETAPDDEAAEGEDCGPGKKKKMMKSEAEPEPVVAQEDPAVVLARSMAVAMSEAFAPMLQKMDILIAAQSQKPSVDVPVRRSMSPQPNMAPPVAPQARQPGTPVPIGEFVRRSVYGQ